MPDKLCAVMTTGANKMQSNSAEAIIKAVHVFSTGHGEQHDEHRHGSRLPSLWWALTSKSWIKIPINVYVLEHRDGIVLFDAGLDPAIVSNQNYISSAIGRFFMRRLFRLHIGPNDTATRNLGTLGYAASDVTKIVISHLHFDHIGCIGEFPQADLIVSLDEWQQLSSPHPDRDFILREHIKLAGAKWHQVKFTAADDPLFDSFGSCYDLMGDKSMILLPTPGHTPGSISMLIRTVGMPPLLLVGDLTYEVDMLMKDQTPGTGDKDLLKSSFAKVRALKEQLPDLVILPCHDSAANETLLSAQVL